MAKWQRDCSSIKQYISGKNVNSCWQCCFSDVEIQNTIENASDNVRRTTNESGKIIHKTKMFAAAADDYNRLFKIIDKNSNDKWWTETEMMTMWHIVAAIVWYFRNLNNELHISGHCCIASVAGGDGGVSFSLLNKNSLLFHFLLIWLYVI